MTQALYSGAGNVFVIADNRQLLFDLSQITKLCSDQKADGIILVEPSANADVAMRIFNRDNSEAEMCGNGLRCLIHFLKKLGIERPVYRIETLAGSHEGWFHEEEVCIKLPAPTNLKLHVEPGIHFLNTGVPHAVLFVHSLDSIDVMNEGKRLRHSPLFAPAGANVNFVFLQSDGSLSVRTYERGVEGETLACGTGIIASALVAHKIYNLPSPIIVMAHSGEKLKISFNDDWSEVIMQGPARVIKEGQ